MPALERGAVGTAGRCPLPRREDGGCDSGRPALEGAERPGMGPARPAAAAGGERRLWPGVPAAVREEKGLRARHGQVRVDYRVAGAGGDAGGPAARRAPLRRGGEGDGSGPMRGLTARRRPE